MHSRILSVIVFFVGTGCATMSKRDPDSGLTVRYSGTAGGASRILEAVDEPPYHLASEAMERGMSTSLQAGDMRFSAGHSPYVYGAGGGGVIVYGPSGGPLPPLVVPSSSVSAPVSAPSSTAGSPTKATCPETGPTTLAEEVACNTVTIKAILRHSRK